ncbi:MAG: hypothetical protein Q9220_003207 [cf. Caloplaca sp. 1 TL-2023]
MATQTQTQTQIATTATPSSQTLTPHPPYSHHPKIPRGSVTALLNFYQPPTDGSKPFNYVEDPPAGSPQRNYSDITHEVKINDLRDHNNGQSFNLDTHAFAALSAIPTATSRSTFESDDEIKSIYYPEVERLLLKETDAKKVLLFDHTIRLATPGANRAPVNRVHIDQTAASAAQRVRNHLPNPAEAEEALKGRYRIINVWRPLSTVAAHPLAFADSTTVPDDALVGIEHRYPDRTGETAAVKMTEGQSWWYWSGMEGDERLMLCCFDSEKGGRVPHSAFVDPRSEEGVGRESVEVRALVFG